ncbi:MAG: Dual specificity protein phosphatase [Hyphomicrobiales bacterium]|nr:Dual specificity protein phosphatase [Hyphomicrobiales bacterium]
MHDHLHHHNLSRVDERLFVGGAFHCDSIPAIVAAHRIGAVVDLREEACDDEGALAAHGVAFLHLPTPDMCAVSVPMLQRGVAFASGAIAQGRSVLIHCQHGIGRSALLALCVMVHGGLAPLDALERAKTARPLVSPSPAQFEGWRAWLSVHARAAGPPWKEPSFDEFAAIAYRHLRQG